MPFIGIISKGNEEAFLKTKINQNIDRNFEIININKESLENIKNIKFDILVVNENIEELLEKSKYLENIISKTSYIIINSDIKNNLCLLEEKNINIITYGFNSKATITVSSIKEENIMVCIQRNFKNINKDLIEEQEIDIKTNINEAYKLYNILIIVTILLIYGKKLQKI